jgi:putative transposase
VKPQAKREVVQALRQEHHLSERRACQAVGLSRSVYRYQPDTTADQPIVEVLLQLAHQKPELGFAKLFQLLRRQGHLWNRKLPRQVYSPKVEVSTLNRLRNRLGGNPPSASCGRSSL